MRCVKCGKLLQSVFAGIAMDFKNPIEIKDEQGFPQCWLICNNPSCDDGRHNASVPESKDLPF
jgi:phage FluMu protein Com